MSAPFPLLSDTDCARIFRRVTGATRWDQEHRELMAEIEAAVRAPLLARIAELEGLCDETYVAQGADAYNHATGRMEQWQSLRSREGKDPGTTGSLCDGIAWMQERIAELEREADALREAGEVMALLSSGDWKLTKTIPSDDLTDEANARSAWFVERQHPPFGEMSGMRLWTGPSALGAFKHAMKSLGIDAARTPKEPTA